MHYKGYTAKIEFDNDREAFYGEVIGLRDAIMFEGNSVKELKNSFHTAVNDYLGFCKSRGQEPEKPYSGKFLVRVSPALHRKLSLRAQKEGKSVNAWVEGSLAKAIENHSEARVADTFNQLRQAGGA